ncbi:Anti-sigma-K factor rskA [compost metagenome]
MNESDDELQHLAGEYVLGTLSAAQRKEVERRLPFEPALQHAVAQWEQRLMPLTAIPEPQELPAQLWPRIAKSIQPATRALESGWKKLWNDVRLWRVLSASSMAAAVLLGVLMMTRPVATETKFMVVLVDPKGQTPGWIVQAKMGQQIQLQPLGQETVPANKSLQFWTKGDDWKGPVSLGLVSPGKNATYTLNHLPPMQANQLFEITLEPEAGSPIGRPTGPILYIGRAVKMT